MCPEWAAAIESIARPRASLAAVARAVLVSASTAVAMSSFVNCRTPANLGVLKALTLEPARHAAAIAKEENFIVAVLSKGKLLHPLRKIVTIL